MNLNDDVFGLELLFDRVILQPEVTHIGYLSMSHNKIVRHSHRFYSCTHTVHFSYDRDRV